MDEADHTGDLSEFTTQCAKRIERAIDQAVQSAQLKSYQQSSLTWASSASVGLSITDVLNEHFRRCNSFDQNAMI
jgi:hypothetical protein